MGDIDKLEKIVFILGMHRSGTSALTRMVNILGVSLGGNLLKGHHEINAKGFWENKELIAVHERILAGLNSTWFDGRPLPEHWWLRSDMSHFGDQILEILKKDFEDSPTIALKDPRLCRLLPFWLNLLQKLGAQPYCVLTVRNPIEVWRSLQKRDGFDEGTAFQLWLTYVLEAEYYSRNLPRTLVSYDDLLTDWIGTAQKMACDLDFEWPNSIEKVTPVIREELTSELRHHKVTEIGKHGRDELQKKANEVYEKLISNGLDSEAYFDDARQCLKAQAPFAHALADALHRTNLLLVEKTKQWMSLGKAYGELVEKYNQERERYNEKLREHDEAKKVIDEISSRRLYRVARFLSEKRTRWLK